VERSRPAPGSLLLISVGIFLPLRSSSPDNSCGRIAILAVINPATLLLQEPASSKREVLSAVISIFGDAMRRGANLDDHKYE